MQASWCWLPAGAPAGTPPCDARTARAAAASALPQHRLGQARSPFGERVITGLPEGVSLRLEGESFKRVLALGGGERQPGPGHGTGAAFSTPTEGWLGESAMPVHLTRNPQPSRLAPWPVSFRHPLLAIAPQPGAPVGALASEALAVGEDGAVARYKPGRGLAAGKPVRARAGAWKRTCGCARSPGRRRTRAYAVGDEGEMWLWRAKPACGNAIRRRRSTSAPTCSASPSTPTTPRAGTRSGTTAVGQGGVLLRYGKTWTEETALPPQVAGREPSTRSRSPARRRSSPTASSPTRRSTQFVGGLLVNEGSGWRVDQEAEAVAGAGASRGRSRGCPTAAPRSWSAGGEGRQRVRARSAPARPGRRRRRRCRARRRGSLALFREGGALRAIVTAGGRRPLRGAAARPAGVPAAAGSHRRASPRRSGKRRRAAPDRDRLARREPRTEPGRRRRKAYYVYRDLPYRPDPIFAVLVDPTGTQGWAVGGIAQQPKNRLETADVERYPADGVTTRRGALRRRAAGAASHRVTRRSRSAATRSARRPAPTARNRGRRARRCGCARRWRSPAGSGIGAPGRSSTPGPTVTAGQGRRAPNPARSRSRASSNATPRSSPALGDPRVDTIAPGPRRAPEQEAARARGNGVRRFPRPFGDAGAAGPVRRTDALRRIGGCESAYCADEQEGVWVLVLDDSQPAKSTRRSAVVGRRAAGRPERRAKPAIVVGQRRSRRRPCHRRGRATELARAARRRHPGISGSMRHEIGLRVASAYFYDSPEENVDEAPADRRTNRSPTFGSGHARICASPLREAAANFHGASGDPAWPSRTRRARKRRRTERR